MNRCLVCVPLPKYLIQCVQYEQSCSYVVLCSRRREPVSLRYINFYTLNFKKRYKAKRKALRPVRIRNSFQIFTHDVCVAVSLKCLPHSACLCVLGECYESHCRACQIGTFTHKPITRIRIVHHSFVTETPNDGITVVYDDILRSEI